MHRSCGVGRIQMDRSSPLLGDWSPVVGGSELSNWKGLWHRYVVMQALNALKRLRVSARKLHRPAHRSKFPATHSSQNLGLDSDESAPKHRNCWRWWDRSGGAKFLREGWWSNRLHEGQSQIAGGCNDRCTVATTRFPIGNASGRFLLGCERPSCKQPNTIALTAQFSLARAAIGEVHVRDECRNAAAVIRCIRLQFDFGETAGGTSACIGRKFSGHWPNPHSVTWRKKVEKSADRVRRLQWRSVQHEKPLDSHA